jgi:2-hydroxychromene-2-carboxylate isomerase
MTRRFGLTYDYRCPYARIAHEHVLAGLRAGADWEVEFLPFSLGQAHVAEGEEPVWVRPDDDSGLLALQASIAVRDNHREHFEAVHHALFEHRHGDAGQLKEWAELAPVLDAAGVDAATIRAEIDSGQPLATVEKEHTSYVESHNVWGVPTFIVDDRAVFLRLLHMPTDDPRASITTIDGVLQQIDWPILNEFKHTRIPR